MRYLRPKSIPEAVSLLDEGVPLGGGTALTPDRASIQALIDLSELGLDEFDMKGGIIKLGATLTLQAIFELADQLPAALIDSIRHEAAWNLRNAATLGGTLVAADGLSPSLTVLLALGGAVKLEPGGKSVGLDEFLDSRVEEGGRFLLTGFEFQVPKRVAFSQVGRTPMDRPLVCACAALTIDEEIGLALGGFGTRPIRLPQAEAGLNAGQDIVALKSQVEAACKDAGDAFASSTYRSHTAGILVERLVNEVQA
jgi:CO/xanthine dehydrogenase FAD-binding subunit